MLYTVNNSNEDIFRKHIIEIKTNVPQHVKKPEKRKLNKIL